MTSPPFYSNDPSPTYIYTLSLQRRSSDLEVLSDPALRESLPRRAGRGGRHVPPAAAPDRHLHVARRRHARAVRSEEHTSELQSLRHLVCRLLLEKKK